MRSELPWCVGGGGATVVVAAAVVFIIIVLSGINYEMIEHANKQTNKQQPTNSLYFLYFSLYLSLCLRLSVCLSLHPSAPTAVTRGSAKSNAFVVVVVDSRPVTLLLSRSIYTLYIYKSVHLSDLRATLLSLSRSPICSLFFQSTQQSLISCYSD